MERLIILLGRLYKSVTPTICSKSHVGRFMPLVGMIGRLVEPPLKCVLPWVPRVRNTPSRMAAPTIAKVITDRMVIMQQVRPAGPCLGRPL